MQYNAASKLLVRKRITIKVFRHMRRSYFLFTVDQTGCAVKFINRFTNFTSHITSKFKIFLNRTLQVILCPCQRSLKCYQLHHLHFNCHFTPIWFKTLGSMGKDTRSTFFINLGKYLSTDNIMV